MVEVGLGLNRLELSTEWRLAGEACTYSSVRCQGTLEPSVGCSHCS